MLADANWLALSKLGHELFIYLQAFLLVSVVAALVIYFVCKLAPWNFRLSMLGAQKNPTPRWNIQDFLLVYVLITLFSIIIASLPGLRYQPTKLDAQDVMTLSVGWNIFSAGMPYPSFPAPIQQVDVIQAKVLKALVYTLLFNLLSVPVLIFLVFQLMKRVNGAEPYHMGVHRGRWRENIVAGFLLFLIVLPICIGLNGFFTLPFWEKLWGKNSSHTVSVLLNASDSIWVWVLLFALTCVHAPLLEELLIRGIFQPIVVKFPLIADIVLAISMVFAIYLITRIDSTTNGLGFGPVFYLVVVALAYWGLEKSTEKVLEPGVARGVFASSLVFAMMHYEVWPSPIALFLLGIGLGLLAYRSRSIIGCMVCHLLFNLTSMVASLLSKYSLSNIF